MANFIQAFEKTMGHEGGYTNNPLDRGGETYRGISRKYHPNWEGWELIDNYKKKGNLDIESGECTIRLQDAIYNFYKFTFWNKFNGDEIPNQQIAEELFDTSVNVGIKPAVTYLQIALNCLNRNQTLFPDLTVDGQFGFKTLNSIRNVPHKDISLLFKMMNVLQGNHYIDIMLRDPTQETFCRGWFSRVIIYKE